jgi:hypothetical protein
MSVTAQNIMDDARALLADVSGLIFDNTKLLPFVGMAHREAFRALESVQRPSVIRETFHNLPAHTSVLSADSLVATDMDEPVIVEERGNLVSVNVTGCTVTSGVASVSTAPTLHGLATGRQVVLLNVGGISGINGLFTITVTSTTAFTVNGAVAAGSYSSGGTVSWSNEAFQSMDCVQRVEKVLTTEQQALLQWAWSDDKFHFPPSSQTRQIRIQYVSSGTAITSASDVLVPDELRDFLALRTAGLAAMAHGAEARGQVLNVEALGPTLQPDATGGALRAALLTGIRSMQRATYRRLPFRSPRANLLQLY